jgi:glycosyltransferase involved in cell wall biosynthesis
VESRASSGKVQMSAEGRSERLAILMPSLGGGGAQRSMIRLAGGIADRGHAVDVVLAQADGHYLDEIAPSVRVVDLRAPRMSMSLPALVRYLRAERPAAMLAALNYVNIISLWARRLAGVGTRLVVSERNTLSVAVRQRPTWRLRLRPHLIRRFYQWADGIVAVSGGVADDLSRVTGLPRERIDVIPNPVITPALKAMAEADLDHPWMRPGEPPVAIGLGRLVPQKDFATLIRAFAKVRERRPARLLILGEGPERASLESLIAEHGLRRDVQLPGWVTNPYPFLRRASAFVLSSRWEGLPGVLIEAMYCGPPVISTDCPSGPREILEGGKHGQLVPVGDVGALSEEIERALSGALGPPEVDSWLPYRQDVVVDRYLQLMVGA